jgi:hypothetical protein
VLEGHISAPAIAFRNVTTDKSSFFEYFQMMSQQIAGHPYKLRELTDRSISQDEIVDDL